MIPEPFASSLSPLYYKWLFSWFMLQQDLASLSSRSLTSSGLCLSCFSSFVYCLQAFRTPELRLVASFLASWPIPLPPSCNPGGVFGSPQEKCHERAGGTRSAHKDTPQGERTRASRETLVSSCVLCSRIASLSDHVDQTFQRSKTLFSSMQLRLGGSGVPDS